VEDFLEKNGSGIWESVDWWRIVATVLMWYGDFLDFTVSEKENDVSNEVEKQVPGVPDGYRLVAIRKVKSGEQYIDSFSGKVSVWLPCPETASIRAIVEPIEPPKPKTEEVVLNKYLVRSSDGGHWMLIVCTAGYADTFFSNYKLIGPSETIEVEVGV
jgi:hypothetical protein